jgi:hypothetical protein
MSLADRLGPPKSTARPCKAGRVIAELNDGDRATLDAAWDVYTMQQIAEALASDAAGAVRALSPETVRRHRKGQCGCERPR